MKLEEFKKFFEREYKNVTKELVVKRRSVYGKLEKIKSFDDIKDDFRALSIRLNNPESPYQNILSLTLTESLNDIEKYCFQDTIEADDKNMLLEKLLVDNFNLSQPTEDVEVINSLINNFKEYGFVFPQYDGQASYYKPLVKYNKMVISLNIKKLYILESNNQIKTKYTIKLNVEDMADSNINHRLKHSFRLKIYDKILYIGKKNNCLINLNDPKNNIFFNKKMKTLFFVLYKDIKEMDMKQLKEDCRENPEMIKDVVALTEMFVI